MKYICVITDNEYIYNEFRRIIRMPVYANYQFDFYFSEKNLSFCEKYNNEVFKSINLKKTNFEEYSKYDLFLSLHCKQLFPENLVNNFRCINIHPGYNPHNRGWFPQVFSILNKKPVGVTIHEIDNELDHGPIIYQEYVDINAYDTSWSVYHRIQEKEVEMLEKYLLDIIEKNYTSRQMTSEGNVNYQADFDRLCSIDLQKEATYGEVIDFLRAMTFDKYDNAYFKDEKGNKIYISINLKKSEENQ